MLKYCQKLLDYFNKIPFGVLSDKLYTGDELTDDVFYTKWNLLTPSKVKQGGICWDVSNVIRLLLDRKNIENYQIYCQMDNKQQASHTFNIVKINNKFYILDGSWKKFKTLSQFNSIKQCCFQMARRMFKQHKGTSKIFFVILETKAPYGSDCKQYMDEAHKNKTIFRFKKVNK